MSQVKWAIVLFSCMDDKPSTTDDGKKRTKRDRCVKDE
jgi:hypothetical protein